MIKFRALAVVAVVAMGGVGVLVGNAQAADTPASVGLANPALQAQAFDLDKDGKLDGVQVRNAGTQTALVRVIMGEISKAKDVLPGETWEVKDKQDRVAGAAVTGYLRSQGEDYFTVGYVRAG